MRALTRATVFAIVAASSLGHAAHAAAPEPSLFANLKTFCLDTRAVTDKVTEAAHAAGAAEATVPGLMMLLAPGMTPKTWSLDRPDGKLAIAAATSAAAPGQDQPQIELCVVQSTWKDDAGIARIRDWLGVTGKSAPAGQPENYYFSLSGDGSVAWAFSAYESSNQRPAGDSTVWSLMLVPAGDGLSINVLHFTPMHTDAAQP